jgi:serine/threonine protein kinase
VLIAYRLDQWVSIKIITADRTNQSRELHNLRALAEHTKGSLCAEYIVQLLDDFLHQGPNGCHQCLVFELLGPTINIIVNDYHEEGERLDTETVLKISRQLLHAVVFIHAAGYAHGGKVDQNLLTSQAKQLSMPGANFLQTLALETLPSRPVAYLIHLKRSFSKYLGSRNRKI